MSRAKRYESPALTAELQARMIVEVKHSKPLVTNAENISAAVRWRIEQLPGRSVAEQSGLARSQKKMAVFGVRSIRSWTHRSPGEPKVKVRDTISDVLS